MSTSVEFLSGGSLSDRLRASTPEQSQLEPTAQIAGGVERAEGGVHVWPSSPICKAATKRLFDIVFSATALVMLLPAFLFIAALVKFTSPGPVLFKQKRYGKGRELFIILKFRTMHSHAQARDGAVVQAATDDARLTPVGQFLRRTSLDELPQFWNVLKGEMSIVGPRPHAPLTIIDGLTYEELVAPYDRRHAVRPGLTGLAQVSGFRGPIPSAAAAEARFATDILYGETATMITDLSIILKTCKQEFLSRTRS